MKTFKILVAAGLLLGATSVMADDDPPPPPPWLPGQFSDPNTTDPTSTTGIRPARPGAIDYKPADPTADPPEPGKYVGGDAGSVRPTDIDFNGKFEETDATNNIRGAKRNLNKKGGENNDKLISDPDYNPLTSTGASGPGHDLTSSDGGTFTFAIPDAFLISCDESNATLNADQGSWSGGNEKVTIEDMMKPTTDEVKDAKAYISCRLTTTRSKFYLYLNAKNGGKMRSITDDGSGKPVYLQVAADGPTKDAELGMAVKFIKSWYITSDLTAGYGNDVKIFGSGGVGKAVTTNGNGDPAEGWYLGSLAGDVNLASIVGGSSNYTRFSAWSSNNAPISTGLEFEIHAAIVTAGGYDIASNSGIYKETIEITLDSKMAD